MNSSLQHSIIDDITMMLNTKMFVPRYFQLKLHFEAQISCGVPARREQFPPVELASWANNSISWAVQTIADFYLGNKQYAFLPHCS